MAKRGAEKPAWLTDRERIATAHRKRYRCLRCGAPPDMGLVLLCRDLVAPFPTELRNIRRYLAESRRAEAEELVRRVERFALLGRKGAA